MEGVTPGGVVIGSDWFKGQGINPPQTGTYFKRCVETSHKALKEQDRSLQSCPNLAKLFILLVGRCHLLRKQSQIGYIMAFVQLDVFLWKPGGLPDCVQHSGAHHPWRCARG